MKTCVWCERPVAFYVCPKCRKTFKRVCKDCHPCTRSKKHQETIDYSVNENKIMFGSASAGYGGQDDDPWQQNAIKHMEDG